MKFRLMHLYQRLRSFQYRMWSNWEIVEGKPIVHQPVQVYGKGKVRFKGRVHLGVFPSPGYLSGYIYIAAMAPEAVVEIEDGVYINNNTFIISDGAGIVIGARTLIGANCEILDSDFHNTHPEKRRDSSAVVRKGKVVIGEDVMIGSNVRILKGVKIGKNSVISNGSVVTRSIPENMLAYGNPVKCGPLIDSEKWRTNGMAPAPAVGTSE
ncbi:MAG TPA: acyltransferase [Verrucomicrobiae bacterium]|nr:acyltransferase [Verrucomicrobiae bacterium]